MPIRSIPFLAAVSICSIAILEPCFSSASLSAANNNVLAIIEGLEQQNRNQDGTHEPLVGQQLDVPSTFYERDNLTFTIDVVFPMASDGDNISLTGNGLDLSNINLEKVDQRTWRATVTYKDTPFGATCSTQVQCSNFIPSGGKLTLRAVLTRDGVSTEMKGLSYEIPFPLSQVSSLFPEDEHPRFTVYPVFFTQSGQVVTLNITSHDSMVGTRLIEVYLPPSVTENPQQVYDVIIGFDLNQDVMPVMKEALDYEFGEAGRAKEAVVIGHGNFSYVDHSDRVNMLTPTTGITYDCVEGTFADGCNNCIPLNGTFAEYMHAILFEGCTVVSPAGGYADRSLDFVLHEVWPKVNELLSNSTSGISKLTEDRDRTMIFGYSLGGLMTCYALWTRPEIFGRGACQSASLWWPLSVDYEAETWSSGYYFLNTTLKSNLDNRPHQQILLDVGEEEDPTMHMVRAPQIVFETLSAMDNFVPNENLWFHAYPGQSHSFESWIGRAWSPLGIWSDGRAYP